MGGAQQPFLYEAEKYDTDRFPSTPFDPKAVTRASLEPKRPRPKSNGPLVGFNQHPDSHQVLGQRSINWKPMSGRTKWWIKAMRVVQMLLRILELNGAIGLLVLVILISNMPDVTAWVMRITPGIIMIHSVYGIYHLSRAAGGRSPGSSAAYHTFAALSDLCILPIFAYAALAVRDHGSEWRTRLEDQKTMKIFIPAMYYLLIGDGGLHLLSLTISLWLALMFRRIHNMPPDMNPLESHLTARPHKRNKSSIATTSIYTESEKRLSTPLEERRRSGAPYEELTRNPRVPFMHTRQGSESTLRTRDSRGDLPSRQYQILASNSPRNSTTSVDMKRMSAPPPRTSGATSQRGSYTELPIYDTYRTSTTPSSSSPTTSRPGSGSRFSTGTVTSYIATPAPAPPQHRSAQSAQPRAARFTEAWYASESLVNRTQQRARAEDRAARQKEAAAKRREYEALAQPYDYHEEDGAEESDGLEDVGIRADEDDDSDLGTGVSSDNHRHPNPLGSNPLAPAPARAKTPYYDPAGIKEGDVLSDISLNDRRVSGGGRDITDEKPSAAAALSPWQLLRKKTLSGGSHVPRNRNSSIQPESDFYSKPYGELKCATPPVMIGAGRQVSSGNDYGAADFSQSTFGRRGVSGKIAEEGRGGSGMGYHSGYGMDD